MAKAELPFFPHQTYSSLNHLHLSKWHHHPPNPSSPKLEGAFDVSLSPILPSDPSGSLHSASLIQPVLFIFSANTQAYGNRYLHLDSCNNPLTDGLLFTFSKWHPERFASSVNHIISVSCWKPSNNCSLHLEKNPDFLSQPKRPYRFCPLLNLQI